MDDNLFTSARPSVSEPRLPRTMVTTRSQRRKLNSVVVFFQMYLDLKFKNHFWAYPGLSTFSRTRQLKLLKNTKKISVSKQEGQREGSAPKNTEDLKLAASEVSL